MLVNCIIASEVIFLFMLEYHMVPCLVHYDFNNSRLFFNPVLILTSDLMLQDGRFCTIYIYP